MKKLNKKKVEWIVREVEKRKKGLWTIAQIQKITPQHVCKVYQKYKTSREPYKSYRQKLPKTPIRERMDLTIP